MNWGRKPQPPAAQLEAARKGWEYLENLPAELVGARLVLSETLLRCSAPVALSGKADQGYLTTAGLLVLVDSKHRQVARVEPDDVLQLSTYRTLIRHAPGWEAMRDRVAGHAYVRIEDANHGVTYLRTPLLNDAAVMRAHARVVALRAGRVDQLALRPSRRVCGTCVGQAECPKRAA